MATETEFHHQNPRSVSVSEMLDHGSISFGRFSAESLAWEKWSVFSHNRCQEELEKFKAPGFVAQKKAFFEEYYKKPREMKGLQAQHQEELNGQITQVEAGDDASLLKEEKEFSYINPIQTLENDASSANSDASLEGNEDKQETDAKEVLRNLSSKKATTASLCSTEPDQLTKHTPKMSNSGIKESREIVISNNVKNIANKSKSQGNVASSGNISKMGNRSKKDGVKSSDKTKPSPHDKITAKAQSSSVVLGQNCTLKVTNGNKINHVSYHRKTTESSPGSTVRLPSASRNRLVSSSLSGKTGQLKTQSNHRDLTDKFRRSVPNSLQSSQCSLKNISSDGWEQKRKDSTRPKNTALRNTLNLRSGVGFSQRSCVEERKQEEVEDKSTTTITRVSKSATITPSNNHKNLKSVQKSTTLPLANLAQARKVEARPKIPSWR